MVSGFESDTKELLRFIQSHEGVKAEDVKEYAMKLYDARDYDEFE